VVERGTHDALAAIPGGRYAALVAGETRDVLGEEEPA
jgi:hypothetical protein